MRNDLPPIGGLGAKEKTRHQLLKEQYNKFMEEKLEELKKELKNYE